MIIHEFNAGSVQLLQQELQTALDHITAKFGLKSAGLVKGKSNLYKLSIELNLFTETEVNRELLVRTAATYGLAADVIDSFLIIKNKRYRIIDFATGLYPVVVEDVDTNDRYKLSPKQVLTAERTASGINSTLQLS